jgi:enoyl-CoA hydratase
MGGGVGLSVHGSHRVATKRTLFAMPETGIGLFPDVGGSWFLPRCPGRIGTWLGLTGTRLGAADLAYAGLATHVAPSASLDGIAAALAEANWTGEPGAVVDRVLAEFAETPGPSDIARHRAAIDRCFGFDRIEDIFNALKAEGTEWALATLDNLMKMSPTSLKVTLREIRLGAALDFDACMTMEYRLSQGCMTGHDFYEGIRALLVDKDRSPRWRPALLDEVGEAEVERFFAPPAGGDLTFTA